MLEVGFKRDTSFLSKYPYKAKTESMPEFWAAFTARQLSPTKTDYFLLTEVLDKAAFKVAGSGFLLPLTSSGEIIALAYLSHINFLQIS